MKTTLAFVFALSGAASAEWFGTIEEAEKAAADRKIPLLVYVWRAG